MQSGDFPFSPSLSVERIGSIRHFECSSPISLSAIPPCACTFLYAASQEVLLSHNSGCCLLKAGDAVLLPPALCPALHPAPPASPLLLLISFSSSLPLPDFLFQRTFTLSRTETGLLAQLLLKSKNASAADTSVCILLLEQLLSLLISRHPADPDAAAIAQALQQSLTPGLPSPPLFPMPKAPVLTAEDKMWRTLLLYLQNHLHTSLSLSRICRDNSISRSRLEKLFHERSGLGAIAFFSRMKIEAAKQLICTSGMNHTQIAAALGYSSVPYFSRQFKKHTKMTPSEYSRLTGKYSGTPPVS